MISKTEFERLVKEYGSAHGNLGYWEAREDEGSASGNEKRDAEDELTKADTALRLAIDKMFEEANHGAD